MRGPGDVRDQHEASRAFSDLPPNFGQLVLQSSKQPLSRLGRVKLTSRELDLKEDEPSVVWGRFWEPANGIPTAVRLTNWEALDVLKFLDE